MMYRFVLMLMLALMAVATACGIDKGDEPVIVPDQPQPESWQPDTLRVLAIGNSYSIDAFALLPFVLRQVSPGTHIVVGILYRGGADLGWHLTSLKTGRAYEAYYKWTSGQPQWSRLSTVTTLQALADEQWDCVTLQQVSAQSIDYGTISPFLRPMVSLLRDSGYHGQLAWVVTPAYPDGSTRLTNGTLKQGGVAVSLTSDQMLEAIGQASMQVMQTGCCDLLLPCGTALQNARHTALGQYGDWGQMTNEGFHLQSGIGMYVEACAAAMALLGTTFDSCRISIQQADYQPLSRGRQVGMGFDNQDIAVGCAARAYFAPYYHAMTDTMARASRRSA